MFGRLEHNNIITKTTFHGNIINKKIAVFHKIFFMKSIFPKTYLMYLQYSINIVHKEKYFVKLCFIFIKTI